ncbi:inactive rhomboid protein [Wolffia australiana]
MDSDQDLRSLSSISSFSTPFSLRSDLSLKSCFVEARRVDPWPRKKLSWLSLHGRLEGAEETSCAKSIGGSLNFEESFAWDLFSPLQRVLAIAIVAAAAANGEKLKQISQLQKSVHVRDMVLAAMQQKLDDLCDQMNGVNGGGRDCGGTLFSTYDEYSEDEKIEEDEEKLSASEHSFKLNHHEKAMPDGHEKTSGLLPGKDDVFVVPISREQDERRMSDLSYCASVASSTDVQQLSTFVTEPDFYNLRRECEEKEGAIKELAASAKESSIASAKRISDLEDIIRRKNMVISKQKKDMLILEQKLIQFMRQRRSSSSSSSLGEMKLPPMSSNLLYDMSSSSPSGSDSDSSDSFDQLDLGNSSNSSNLLNSIRRTPRRRWF